MDKEVLGVVIDNGSGEMKAGFAGEDCPRSIFPCVVGTPKYQGTNLGLELTEDYFGEGAKIRRGLLNLENPFEHGTIQNWDGMEKIWSHTFFAELRVSPDKQPVLLTEIPLNAKIDREKMTQIMFETFGVPHLYVSIQATLSVYSTGRTTGIVCDSGQTATHTVPVYEGFAISHAISKIPLAGRDLTKFMNKLLLERGYNFVTNAESEIVKDVKEKVCVVALDFQSAIQQAADSSDQDKDYELPDGNRVKIGDARFRCPEYLFSPLEMNGSEFCSIQEAISKSIMDCDVDVKSELYNNVILSGGSTLFEGIVERLQKEIKARAPKTISPTMVPAPDRRFAAWIGGSMLSSMSTFEDISISKKEYDERGATIVHRKCF